jgi:uncharacterized protein
VIATPHAQHPPNEAGVDEDDELVAGPLRRCVVTRQALPMADLIRFVAGPDGKLVPDLDQRLPGRGAWVTANRQTIEKAIKTRAFGRSLKSNAVAPDGMVDQLQAQLRQRLAGSVSLANKAGQLIIGFQQVDAALDKGHCAVLLHGRDAAADGCNKLDRKFRAIARDGGPEAKIFDLLTISELGLAIGRPSVVHAALKSGGLAERFTREAERLARYDASSPVDASGLAATPPDDTTSKPTNDD